MTYYWTGIANCPAVLLRGTEEETEEEKQPSTNLIAGID